MVDQSTQMLGVCGVNLRLSQNNNNDAVDDGQCWKSSMAEYYSRMVYGTPCNMFILRVYHPGKIMMMDDATT